MSQSLLSWMSCQGLLVKGQFARKYKVSQSLLSWMSCQGSWFTPVVGPTAPGGVSILVVLDELSGRGFGLRQAYKARKRVSILVVLDELSGRGLLLQEGSEHQLVSILVVLDELSGQELLGPLADAVRVSILVVLDELSGQLSGPVLGGLLAHGVREVSILVVLDELSGPRQPSTSCIPANGLNPCCLG